MDIDVKLLTGLGGVPLITAAVNMTKPLVPDSRFHPFISVGYGVLLNELLALVVGGDAERFVVSGILGVIAGLGASGLYSVASKGKDLMTGS